MIYDAHNQASYKFKYCGHFESEIMAGSAKFGSIQNLPPISHSAYTVSTKLQTGIGHYLH